METRHVPSGGFCRRGSYSRSMYVPRPVEAVRDDPVAGEDVEY